MAGGTEVTTVVSLLPTAAHDRLVKMLTECVSGSFTIHIQAGEVRSFEVRETASVRQPTTGQ